MHRFHYRKHVVLISLMQNAVEEAREAPWVRAGAVGAVLHVEARPLGGDEGPQEEGVGSDGVGAAIEVEDAAHPAGVAEDVEEGSASIPISICMRCSYRFTIRVHPRRASPFISAARLPSLNTGWTQQNGSRRPLQGIPGQAKPPKLKYCADRICRDSPSGIPGHSRTPLHLLNHPLLSLILHLLGQLV